MSLFPLPEILFTGFRKWESWNIDEMSPMMKALPCVGSRSPIHTKGAKKWRVICMPKEQTVGILPLPDMPLGKIAL